MAKETIKNGNGASVVLSPTRAEMNAILKQARAGLKNKKSYQKVAALLDRWVQKNFQSEGKLYSKSGWQSFSKFNVRKFKDSKAKLLQDKGRLRSSFVPFYSVFNAGIGSNLGYALDHEEGNKGENLPARPMLPERKHVWPEIKKTLSMHTKETLAKAFSKARKG